MANVITEKIFQEKVVKRSFQVPVVLDFWAEWCGPCRMLGPVLEKLEKDYKGSFDLVKINTEENQQLAAMFQISSIPDVRIIKEGKLVDHFMGALPEKEIRKILDKHVSPVEEELDDDSWESVAKKNPMRILDKLANTEPKNIPPERDQFIWKAYLSHVANGGKLEEIQKLVTAVEEENVSFQNQRKVTLSFLEKGESSLDDLKKLLDPVTKISILDKHLQTVIDASYENKPMAKENLIACFYFLPPGDKDAIEYQKKLSRALY